MKKLLGLISVFTLSFLIAGGTAKAEESKSVVELDSDDDVIEILDDQEFSIFGLSAPPNSAVVDLTKKDLEFAGQASGSTLYTNSNFKGQKKVTYSIKNTSSSNLTVKLHKKGSLFALRTFTVNAKTTKGGALYPSGDLDASALYYLSFSAPSNFSGRLY